MAIFKVKNVTEHVIKLEQSFSDIKPGRYDNGKFVNGQEAVVTQAELNQIFPMVQVLEMDGKPFIDERFIEVENEQKKRQRRNANEEKAEKMLDE